MSRAKAIVVILCALYALVSLLAGWLVYRYAYLETLDQLEETGRIRVQQASDRLMGQLSGYSYLVNLLARHPLVIRSVVDGVPPEAADDLLIDSVLTYGADRISLTDADGRLVASSSPETERDQIEGTVDTSLLRAALNGRLGLEAAFDDDGRRVIRLSRGVLDGAAPAKGAIFVTIDVAALEFEWGIAPEAICFFDASQTVFASTRQSLLRRQDKGLGDGDPRFEPFPHRALEREGGHEVWSFSEAFDLPQRALVVTRALPQVNMTARGFLDTAPARTAAILRGLLTTTVLGAVGLAMLIAALWRRRMADRLAIEAAVNARLEERVERRTSQLKVAQDQLVQASKLTALGEMSAGISHELNQPLAAILNLSENGRKLLDRKRFDEAGENLGQIAGQVQRIDKIIRNLRAFARNEGEGGEPVDLVAAVDYAITLTLPSLEKDGIALSWSAPERQMLVDGGEVRLQQVVVNILSNAQDAMVSSDIKRIDVMLKTDTGEAVLEIADSGPGIPDPTRVFEPFYTTKELGASKGLGLGLSISYGIIRSLGGTLSCHNSAHGGAIFTIRLPLTDRAVQ
ncbi:sensor histidine kinase [Nisaea denitrificans]|uniref:sensor histidine kinase n=1 Tax=Nisaea denitrificans TaxID=390877 RepID=UPI0006867D73|nr:ATP-binding protein [Nisaea denitrificans]